MTLLEARGVTKRFAGIVALDDVDLACDEREIVGLIGPNGAGKTTLFNCLTGVLRPDAGRVLFEGKDLGALAVHRRARLGIARTFQRMELFAGMTVRDHLLVADRAHRRAGGLPSDLVLRGRIHPSERDRVDRVLAQLGLLDDGDRPVDALSLGSGRLVELGRALITEPRLVFLDEPFSGLDRIETDEVVATLQAAHAERDVAIVLVEHDVTAVQHLCERVVVLDYGRVIASGTTDAVLEDPAVRRAYLGVTE